MNYIIYCITNIQIIFIFLKQFCKRPMKPKPYSLTRIVENQLIRLLSRGNYRLILESYDILLLIGCNHD